MNHCDIITEIDGTITASNPEISLIILPDGPARAFNRNTVKTPIGGGKLHAKLNELAADIQQGKRTESEVWEKLELEIDNRKLPHHDRILVGELNGVRVYIQDYNIIMTTRDLYK